MNYLPKFDVLWPGSYPLQDADKACRYLLSQENVLAHWPQLPKKSKKETMLHQSFAGMSSKDGSFPRGYAAGWSAIWKNLSKQKKEITHFKSQIAGPITLFGKYIQENRKSKRKSSTEIMMETIDQWLKHAFWQVDQIKEKGYQPILILDEPLLPIFMGPSSQARAGKTLKVLESIIKRLKKRGAIVGIHCCNRVSPATLIKSGADLIHFDALHFKSMLNPAKTALQDFLKDGGLIAWGMITTTEPILEQTHIDIEDSLIDFISQLETRTLSVSDILSQSMIAPVCGAGLLRPQQMEKIMDTAVLISKIIKTRYKF